MPNTSPGLVIVVGAVSGAVSVVMSVVLGVCVLLAVLRARQRVAFAHLVGFGRVAPAVAAVGDGGARLHFLGAGCVDQQVPHAVTSSGRQVALADQHGVV